MPINSPFRISRLVPLALLSITAFGTATAQPPAKTEGPTLQQFDDAVRRLTLNPHDPYLQYVVLQLGIRERRQEEAERAIDRQTLVDRVGLMGRGRQNQTNLFSTFTGALAIQESLQLDTMRSDQQPLRPQQLGQDFQPGLVKPKPISPEKVSISKLSGPNTPSHPWEKLLGDAKPDVGTLSKNVPEEFYFAEFKSVTKLHEIMSAGDLWAGHIFAQAMGDAQSPGTAARIKKQLGLTNIAPELIDKLGVDSIAVTGSDPFLAEGSDIAILIQGRNIVSIVKQMEMFQDGKTLEGEHVGIKYNNRKNADGSINVYTANPRPDLHVRGNSKPAFLKVLEAIAGKTSDGKAVQRLGESAEFQYVRTRMPRSAAEEDGFVYLSDAFIRHLVGPQLKLTERRRSIVATHLRMIGHAALLFHSEYGRAPKSFEELVQTKCAPDLFGKGRLAHPDGGTYSLSKDGMSGICSKFGKLNAFTPCIEQPVTEVSHDEATQYKQFVMEYSEYWRTYFDPIAIRVAANAKQYRLETLVLPLINNSIYTGLSQGVGKAAAMDLLPTPKREIGGIWLHFDKKPLNNLLGAEQITPSIDQAAVNRGNAARNRVENDLKQIGISHHAYHDAYGKFPQDFVDKKGKALLSWRVAILPYIEQNALYQQFKLDEPWDSDHNKKLIEKIPAGYVGRLKTPRADGKTAFLRPVGKGTMFPPDKKMRMHDITVGTSNTIMTVEVNDDSSVVWTKPDDLKVDEKDPLKGLIRKDAKEFLVGMADGSVRNVRSDIDPVIVWRSFGPQDGMIVDLNSPSGPATPQPKAPVTVQDDLKQIALGVMNYESAFAKFPTTNIRDAKGKSLLSWRVAILPFIEQENLYRQFKLDEPWDSEHNKKLIDKMPRIYQGINATLNGEGKTRYLIPSGKDTLSPPDKSRIAISAITDGLSNTILTVVAAPDSAVIWTKPDDLPFDPKDPLKGLLYTGQDSIDVVMADGVVLKLSPQVDPKRFTNMVTIAGGEIVDIGPYDEMRAPQRGRTGSIFDELRINPKVFNEMERMGIDMNKVRRMAKDGIGDQIGFHMHDAPRLFDSDFSGLFGGNSSEMLGTNIGLAIRFAFGPSSISIPVKDSKIVDEFLDEFDRFLLARRYDAGGIGLSWRSEVDFYKVTFPQPHTIRSLVLSMAGLKWRIYWGRIGDGLYIATRPFILEDIAAAQAENKPSAKSEPSHILFRMRPENWSAVLPGYNLGWSENLRKNCDSNRVMIENVAMGWNDRKPVKLDATLFNHVDSIYGSRPSCPDGGKYELSADGSKCRCSIHGDHNDPKQPAGPSAASSTGRVLKSFAGMTANIRFEDDGLHVIVTMDRK